MMMIIIIIVIVQIIHTLLVSLLLLVVSVAVVLCICEARDGGGVGAALGDGGLGGVVGRVVVEVRQHGDEAVGVAAAGHADLLPGHELERAVGAEVHHAVGLEDELQVGVEGREAVVRRGGLREEQPHGVALVAEGGLHAEEDVAEPLAVDEQVLAVRVQVAGRRAPVLVEVLGVRAKPLVLLGRCIYTYIYIYIYIDIYIYIHTYII